MISGIYAIISPKKPTDAFELAKNYLERGITIIQLRMKNSKPSEIKKQAKKILSLKKKYSFTFIINDDPLLAKNIGADGVHLGQDDFPVKKARKILGPKKIIGLSSHSWAQALKALKNPIDYLALGAIFRSINKPKNHPVVGTKLLAKLVKKSHLPIVAIGGIKKSNIAKVLKAKPAAIAMISGLNDKNLDVFMVNKA